MTACDAAQAAPAFYVRGSAIVGINYNLACATITPECFHQDSPPPALHQDAPSPLR